MTDMTEQKDEQFIEQVAQFLHDEGGFDEAWTNHTWPEHSEDTGRRDGGFVKIVPADVQAKFRDIARRLVRSEEHTSELQSLMRISYDVFCLQKKQDNNLIKTPYIQ